MVVAKYLLDTDWAVYYLRGKEPFVDSIKRYRQAGMAMSIISVAELYEGVFRSPEPEEKELSLNDFLAGLTIMDITKPIARVFGWKRAELKKAGVTVSDFDLMIACTAQHYGLTILTNNKKHFTKIMPAEKSYR
ncbi:MAG: type II toxin-antitoxin system VapC family toxin [Thermoanaerobacteraceae bacterium]|nr:type II toxin-antitoxin system VapC family toxin [Thermoanaerobacteraceae bacterium]